VKRALILTGVAVVTMLVFAEPLRAALFGALRALCGGRP
jgi:hypothetical protein